VIILLCHNFYQEPGGEDQVFADEGWLLESHGHEVIRYTRHNDDLAEMGRWNAAQATLWNKRTREELRRLIRRQRPDVMHCHNTFPLLSPAAYAAANAEGVPVVQTLHNYRLLCPSALFLRNGAPCEDCLGKLLAWPGILHRCYRGSRSATAVVAAMLAMHRVRGTWVYGVQQFVALSEFSRSKFIAGGLPAARLAVKPNFMRHDPGCGSGRGAYAMFIGRLAPEKGVETLLAAWRQLRKPLRLKIAGDGPLAGQVQAAADADSRIEYLERRPGDEVLALLGDAECLLLPSICYENCPKTLIEAYAKGTPVVASRLGALQEMVDHGRTGLLFEAGNAEDLARSLDDLDAGGDAWRQMRQAARKAYEQNYSTAQNYTALIDIYRRVIGPHEAAAPQAVGRQRANVSTAEPQSSSREETWGAAMRVDGAVALAEPTSLRAATCEGTASTLDSTAKPEVLPANLRRPQKYDLFGVQVSATTYDEATEFILEAARQGRPAVVSAHDVHALVTASGNPELLAKVNRFDIITPDGQPVRWALNVLHHAGLRDRVRGPELMLRVCRSAAREKTPIFLYGSLPEVLDPLAANLQSWYPGLQIAGCFSPPFRPLTADEEADVIRRIHGSGASVVFVGLGFPKQDHFAGAMQGRLQAVMVNVGAAFDFHAGKKRMAPLWMQDCGLEWLHRLGHEPRRLWRRYLTANSRFLVKFSLALLRQPATSANLQLACPGCPGSGPTRKPTGAHRTAKGKRLERSAFQASPRRLDTRLSRGPRRHRPAVQMERNRVLQQKARSRGRVVLATVS
jgi:exopolysaccharide biosynthesis WecB/TagA/CpsF family protein